MNTQEDAINAASHLIRTVQTIYYAGTSLGDQSVFQEPFKDAVRDLPRYLQEAEERIKPMLPAIHKMTKGSGDRTIGQFSECTACDLALKLGEDTSEMVAAARNSQRLLDQEPPPIAIIVVLQNIMREKTIIKDSHLVPIRKFPSRSEFDSLLTRVKRELRDVQEISSASDTQHNNYAKATVNDRMAGEIVRNPEAVRWNSVQWAKHLKCAKSSVVATAAWRNLESARIQSKAERMKDRRRKPKASDSRRD